MLEQLNQVIRALISLHLYDSGVLKVHIATLRILLDVDGLRQFFVSSQKVVNLRKVQFNHGARDHNFNTFLSSPFNSFVDLPNRSLDDTILVLLFALVESALESVSLA
jgi:hypothetical protein